MHHEKIKSIHHQVNGAIWLVTVVLMIPALVSLVMMLSYSMQYRESISHMEAIAALKPQIVNEIPEQVWYAVSGRTSFEESGVSKKIQQVNDQLDQLTDENHNSHLEMTIARRTMETLSQYVEKINQNLMDGTPIVQSEKTLEDVRDVAALVGTMLEDCISQEISVTSETSSRLTRVVRVTAFVEMAVVLFALLLSFVTRKRLAAFIHEPIERLERFAGMVAGGNLEARVPPTDVQELENLTDRINVMAERLETLIAQNKHEQENLRKSELRTLQAQINPHFLYNTLDTIIWQAEAGQTEEVIEITRAMSDFFRISLSSGEDWIPLNQEIKHLQGYLSIQKIRYRDILTYEIDMPENTEGIYVLKLLLQPLVENALYHGIKDKRGGGMIRVRGEISHGRLLFSVSDTGRGMTQDQLEKAYARMHGEIAPDTASGGFGLNNVDQRIRLYYNQPFGLTLASGQGGTTVSFDVPIKGKEILSHD